MEGEVRRGTKPSRAEPSRAKPSRAKPSQAKPMLPILNIIYYEYTLYIIGKNMCWGNVCNNIRKQACPELFSCVCVFCANSHKTRRGKFKGQNTQNQRKSQKTCLAFPPCFSCDFSSPSSLQPPPNILAVSAPVCKDIQKRQQDRTTIRLHEKIPFNTKI